MNGSDKSGKGFSGLSNLSAGKNPPVQTKAQAEPDLVAEATPPAPISSQAPPPESRTAVPSWRTPLILAGFCVVGFVLFAVFQGPGASRYENLADPGAAYDAARGATDAAAAAADAADYATSESAADTTPAAADAAAEAAAIANDVGTYSADSS